MTARSLNLLRHPRQGGWFSGVVWQAVCAGAVLGVLVGAAWCAWQMWQYHALQTQQAELQERVQALDRQQAREAARLARDRQQMRQQSRMEIWRQQREQLLRWHGLLESQARQTGLWVQRWQGDGRHVRLQVWLPQPQQVPALLSALSQVSARAWHVQSLADGAQGGIEAVLEVPWPDAAASAAGASRP